MTIPDPHEMDIAVATFQQRVARLWARALGLSLGPGILLGILLLFTYDGPVTARPAFRLWPILAFAVSLAGSTLVGWIVFRLVLAARAPHWIGELSYEHRLEPEALAPRCHPDGSMERKAARVLFRWSVRLLIAVVVTLLVLYFAFGIVPQP